MRTKFLCGLVLVVAMIFSCSLAAFATSTPQIDSILPNYGTNTQSVDVVIEGMAFKKGTVAAKLVKGDKTIAATNLVRVNGEQMTCTFDLKGQELGQWDLVVSNTGKAIKKVKTATMEKAFTIGTVPAPPAPAKAAEAPKAAAAPKAAPKAVDANEAIVSIFFDFDKSNIRDDQFKAMQDNQKVIAAALASEDKNAYKYLVIGGHADERGTREYNIALSAERANAVKKFLVFKGLDPETVLVYAYGEDYPTKEGQDEESWAFNRRVDLVLWKKVPNKDEAVKQ